MMGRSRYLPDQALLDQLFRAAGVIPGGVPPPRDPPAPPRAPPVATQAHPEEPAVTTPADPKPAPSPDPSLGGKTLAARYEEIADWMGSLTGASVAFVADAEGLPLTRTQRDEETFVAVAALLAGVRRDLRTWLPSRSDSTITIELGETGALTLIWAETAIGALAAGVVLPEPIAKERAEMIRTLLIQAAQKEE